MILTIVVAICITKFTTITTGWLIALWVTATIAVICRAVGGAMHYQQHKELEARHKISRHWPDLI